MTPLIGIPACARIKTPGPIHHVGEKYINAVVNGAEGLPVLIPALGGNVDLDELVARLDGLLLTGSPSNVEPHHYGGPASREGTEHDPKRDATTLPLIRKAVAAGLPLLAICRGIQELNVAFGGSLHQLVHEVDGKRDHRSDKSKAIDRRYDPAHPLHLTPGGMLARLYGAEEVMVNSLHAQGIDRLGAGLMVEGTAPDGLIEAVSVIGARAFALGVQWHPEHPSLESPVSKPLFQAFARACRERAEARARARAA
ncbi:MAG: gamma-glutamyl-gamma-aminobutyrate hydrolase family protein [Proteobacteria bacterium]|nr:gamma-glutamyl-gamma-aminobutyrate hydrolase family protein [Pseudomonadota bacterium]MBI3499721.1 gamma-glutamyl-gamma-aminobutyrate hydrolase family protein [Pseudomonadota bacterium]